MRALDHIVKAGTQGDPFKRNALFMTLLKPMVAAINGYFGTEVRGWEHVPKKGPFLIVGNHSGGAVPYDLWFLLGKWLEERGPEAPLYGLTYDLLFASPVAPLLRRAGLIPANHGNAQRALQAGAAVAVFPGGDYEVFRPWTERNRIEFAQHRGFIELAITTGVPVVPMTIHGAHQSTFVLTRGRRLAQLIGLGHVHVHVFPMVWSIPFGPVPAFVPSLNLPAKVTVEFGKPLDWSRYGRLRAQDPRVLAHCYNQITTIMQATLDRLAREHPYPVVSRLRELSPLRLLDQPTNAAHPATRARARSRHQTRRLERGVGREAARQVTGAEAVL